MPSIDSSDQNTIPPTHEDFHWIHGPGKNERFADFIELIRDISAGMHTSMQIICASDLVREINQDCESERLSAPAIGKTDAVNLFRLTMAAAALLRKVSDEHIDRLNKFWDE